MKRIILLTTCILMISASKAIAQDDDNDGIINTVEISIGTDPYDSDTDNDGLLDGTEDVNQDGFLSASESDPRDADTDDDGINDGEEVAFSLNKRNPDTDGDGLTDGLEIGRTTGIPGGTSGGTGVAYLGTSATWSGDADAATKTDPLDADTDNDGISDGGEDKDRDGVKDAAETNPLDADSDDDGLKDGDEDHDDDGILDATETNPMNADTDGDGLKDGIEKGVAAAVPGGTSEGSYTVNRVAYLGTAAGWSADADPSSVTDPRDSDTDNDGLADGAEDTDRDGLLDGTESDPRDADTDDDGINDGEEVAFSLNKRNPDTDGDGLTDGLEI
ncbi:MAG: hypothetical protein R6W31_09010 [Bacteroidales bacterium]